MIDLYRMSPEGYPLSDCGIRDRAREELAQIEPAIRAGLFYLRKRANESRRVNKTIKGDRS